MADEKKVLDSNGLSHFWQGIKAKFIGDVTYDANTKAFKKNRVSSDPSTVVTVASLKADMELDNVGNFKAVSTAAGQGLTETEKANARTNLGLPTSTIYTYKGSVATVAALPTHASTPAPQPGDVWNVTSNGKNYAYVEYNTVSGEDVWDDLGGEFAIESITNSEIDTILAS